MTREIADRVHLLSMNVEGILFEGMWQMPHGVTLNSYIVKGEKTAIIDGFCGCTRTPAPASCGSSSSLKAPTACSSSWARSLSAEAAREA